MPLKLILIRHAKSDWGDPRVDDHDRPLNDRGRHDAPRIGAWLASGGHLPDAALVSTALRAWQTWGLLAAALPRAVPEDVTPALYHADPGAILGALRGAQTPTLALVGHNPGIGEAAHRLVATAPDHDRFADYPTAATTVMEFDIDNWSGIAWGAGRVLAFVTPHDL